MTEPDKKRDKRFKKDIESGLSIKELSEKYGIGERQVSRLKKKLKKEAPQRQVSKETATRQPVSPATEKMAFWLDKDIKEKLKILAIKEKRTASAILREVLGKYLKGKK